MKSSAENLPGKFFRTAFACLLAIPAWNGPTWFGTLARAGDFSIAANPVCGMGKALAEGCNAIREREILDASSPEWSAIGRINYSNTRMRMHCTGTLVASDLVLTAAHCLFDSFARRWLDPGQVHFVAGYQRGDAVAHSTALSYRVDPVHDTTTRNHFHDPRHDWALVRLAERLGGKAGIIPVEEPQGLFTILLPSSALPSSAMAAGYPGLRPHVLSKAANCRIDWRFRDHGMIEHDCPLMQGDSGSPVLAGEAGAYRVIAVNSSVRTQDGRVMSQATLVDTSLLAIKAGGE